MRASGDGGRCRTCPVQHLWDDELLLCISPWCVCVFVVESVLMDERTPMELEEQDGCKAVSGSPPWLHSREGLLCLPVVPLAW